MGVGVGVGFVGGGVAVEGVQGGVVFEEVRDVIGVVEGAGFEQEILVEVGQGGGWQVPRVTSWTWYCSPGVTLTA